MADTGMSDPTKDTCDFCSVQDVHWNYSCRSFEVFTAGVSADHAEMHSVDEEGEWGACDVCHDLIETGQDDELARRAARTSDERIVATIKAFHDLFRANRTGKAVRITGRRN